MDYDIKTQNFEGLLDLLLFFIKRNSFNIYDIPILHITKQFFDYRKDSLEVFTKDYAFK